MPCIFFFKYKKQKQSYKKKPDATTIKLVFDDFNSRHNRDYSSNRAALKQITEVDLYI